MIFWISVFAILFISLILNFCINDKYRKILFFCLFIFISFIGVFRNNIGLDYYAYQEYFQVVTWKNIGFVEPTFIFFTCVLKYLGLSSQVLFAAYALLISLFIFLGLRYYCKDNYYIINNFWLFWCLYFIGWWDSLTAIRQILAVGIFFYYSRYLIESNFKRYFFGIICATCVHYSSIFLLFLYPLRKVRINLKYFFAALSILIFLSSTGIIRDCIIDIINALPFTIYKITAYVNNDTKVLQNVIGERGTGLGTIFYYTVFISAILLADKKNNNVNQFILLIAVGLMLKTVFFMFPPLARLSLYFELFGFLLLANFQKKIFNTIFIIGLSLGMLIVSLHHIYQTPTMPIKDIQHNTNRNIDYKFTIDFFAKKGLKQ